MSPHVVKRPKDAGRPFAPRRGPLAADKFEYVVGLICLALVFSASGAYDTDDLTLLHRFTLWLIVGTLIVGQSTGIDALLLRWLPRNRPMRIVGAGVSILVTVFLMAIELHLLKFTPLLPKKPDPFLEFVVFVSPVVVAVAGFVMFVRFVRWSKLSDDIIDSASAAMWQIGTSVPEKTGLLPPPNMAIVECENWPDAPVKLVKACDHYLEVTTAERVHFVRGRMRDAVAVLSDQGGLQVHRSWWVAQAAIKGVVREGRDFHFELESSERIPIGRGRIRALKLKGWL